MTYPTTNTPALSTQYVITHLRAAASRAIQHPHAYVRVHLLRLINKLAEELGVDYVTTLDPIDVSANRGGPGHAESLLVDAIIEAGYTAANMLNQEQAAKILCGIIEDLRCANVPQPVPAQQHTDDTAVDKFAAAMKGKLAESREKGRRGWRHCPSSQLSDMLHEHVMKGDPRDVANFCMMLWTQGAAIDVPSNPPDFDPPGPANVGFGSLGSAPSVQERQLRTAFCVYLVAHGKTAVEAEHCIGELLNAQDRNGFPF